MVSPETKRFTPPVVVLAGITVSLGAILVTPSCIKDSLTSVPAASTSAFPFPTRSSVSVTPTPSETPSDVVTTPAPEESSATPTVAPTKTKSPTPSPSPTPSETVASPTNSPLNVEIGNSHYIATGAHSGLAYIDSETKSSSDTPKDTHSTEFNLLCGSYVVKIGIVTYTNGDRDLNRDIPQRLTPHPELTAIVCDGNRVAPDLKDDPGKFANYLLPLANIS